jgi:hypothetical protein
VASATHAQKLPSETIVPVVFVPPTHRDKVPSNA